MTNDSMADAEYEREKAQEREAERIRQQRLRDRVPGRKPTGKTKAGDIDGECAPACLYSGYEHGERGSERCNIAVLDEIRGEWEICMDPDVSPATAKPESTA